MHIDSADGHDFHPVASTQVSNEQSDERVQLADLRAEKMEVCAETPTMCLPPIKWSLDWAPRPCGSLRRSDHQALVYNRENQENKFSLSSQ